MKKNILKIVIASLIIVGGLFFYSCQKDNSQEQKQDIKEGRLLTNEQINLIGEKHNEFLKIILENNISNENKIQGVLYSKEVLETKYLGKTDNLTFKRNVASSEKIKTTNEYMLEIKNNLSDKNNFVYFEKVLNYLNNTKKKKDVESISSFLDKVTKDMASNKTEVRDYEAFLVFSSVLKSSAKFWLPKELGGLGNYTYYKNNIASRAFSTSENGENGEKKDEDKWKACASDVLEADAMSATSSFVVAALVTIASGGTLGGPAILGIAIESGVASTWAYYRSDNCK